VNLVPTLYEIGDYAVATELARQYAYAAQVRQGDLDDSTGSNLQADCLAGVYAASGFTGNRGEEQLLFLSPGDLDEAVIAFLLTSDSSADVDANEVSAGTAFERFDAYRDGFLAGTPACATFLE
jgi:predicted metalloprotease